MSNPEIEKIYPLTPTQEGILFHSLMEPNSEAYSEYVSFTIKGDIQPQIMVQSFIKLIERYDVLRTVFIYTDVDQPLQIVLENSEPHIHFKDISAHSDEEQKRLIEDYKIQDQEKGFDLETGPLIRMAMFKVNEQIYKVIWRFHHIIMDGWCLGILARDLFHIYDSLAGGIRLQLGSLYPYSDYIQWLSEQDQEEALQYWRNYLEDYELRAVIPSSKGAILEAGFDHQKYHFNWDAETTSRLQKFAVDNQVTLSTLFHAIWGILLQQYNHSEDVVFGSVVSGRPPELPGIENMVGLFINTIPLRVKYDTSSTFKGLLNEVHDSILDANKYNYVSLADIQSGTVLKNNLINHIIVFENYPLDKVVDGDEEHLISMIDSEMIEHTNYDLDVTVFPERELEVLFTYNGFVYDEDFLRNVEGHLKQIVTIVLEDVNVRVQDIEMITVEEKQRILSNFNQTDTAYRFDKPVHQLFEEQARKYPQKIALIYKEEQITYEQLNSNANRLARIFMERGLQHGDFAAVMLERSPLMVESILAVWKVGAAYIPVDVLYPEERKAGIIADSNAKIVISISEYVEEGLCARYPNRFVDVGNLIYSSDEALSTDVSHPVAINDLAYTLFTSGSTGKPKGVMIEHLGMLNHIWAEADDLALSENIVFAQTANHCFDISVWQFFGALVLGGTTVIYSDDLILAPEQFLNQVIDDQVTLLEVVPSYLTVLLDLMEEKSIQFHRLQHLMITGEAATPALVKRWFTRCPDIKMVNAYGPAEASDDICQYVMDQVPAYIEHIPVGKPLPNIRMYIVNAQMHLCPIGVTGEICVAGIAVGRGYLNDPERTEKVFMDDPFALQSGVRLYKTGDLGRWLPEGNIEFIGRKDHQVKIRGFRIELGEIEHRLTEYDQVREAVVIVKEENGTGKYLCAYYTANIDIKPSDIKANLYTCMPEYMIPQVLVQLKNMPLNANGKINRSQLPELVHERSDTPFIPASNEIEKMLVTIWREVLGVEKVSTKANFFELGGHSLKATVIVSKINGELSVDVKVKDVFQFPTIVELAHRIQGLSEYTTTKISPVEIKDYYPVSPAQRRMFVLHTLEELGSTAYNMPFAYRVQGYLDAEYFRHVVTKFIERHEGFRTSFQVIDGEIVQVIHPEVECKLEIVDLRDASNDEINLRVSSFIQPFDLEVAPLLRFQLLHTGQQEHILLIDMHHIISDGLSGAIMLRELEQLYKGELLTPLEIQYKDFAVWLNERLASEEMKEHETYWLEHFSGDLPVLNIPLDYRRPPLQSFNGHTLHFTINPELSRAIKALVSESSFTLYSVLLAAYNVMLMKYSGQEDIVVGSPIAGRNHQDVQQMLGMFINTVALRNFPDRNKTFRHFVQEVTEHTLSAIDHQDLPFERLVEMLDVARDTSRNPLFDTMFNLTDTEEQEIHIGGMLLTPYELKNNIAKFDLMLDVYTDISEIHFDLQYNTDLFTIYTAEKFGRHLIEILNKATANPDLLLVELDMLTSNEHKEMIDLCTGRGADYDFSRTVHERFEQFAVEQPGRVAVLYGGKEITYADLNAQANRMGHYLRRRLGNFQPDTVVSVMLERSPTFIQSVLGVWKAGGAYVPIDIEYGVKRKAGILEDSGAQVLITRSEYLKDGLDALYGGLIVCLDQIESELLEENDDNVGVKSDVNSLAYILFTSGSTGRPKGVMIEHLGMLNHILAEADELGLNGDLVFAQNANICFDISVWQCFAALALGGTTTIYPNELVMEVERFIERVIEDKVTLLEVVPSYLAVMLDSMEKTKIQLRSLRYLMITGETIKTDLAQRWLELHPDIKLINAYGPAEASDDISQYVIDSIPMGMENIPIGKPIANVTLYVTDEQMKLCPVGVFGEICVSGIGVGRGYINDSERTSQAFINNPFVKDEGRNIRLYRTGDLGRWLPDGNLEFIGRKDFQVKIRGFRIELEEIEVSISQYPNIKQTVVLAREDEKGSKYLCAYVVMESSDTALEDVYLRALKDHLESTLPNYMVPAYFVTLDQMPLLISGKIDRAALPAPNQSTVWKADYTAPRNEVEQVLAVIWEEVLGVTQIGIDHNFFGLGGDSIRAIQISSKLSSSGYTLRMKDLFQNPEIRKLSKYVQLNNREIDQSPVEGNVELTPIQQWFFECDFSPVNHWNQAVVLFKKDGFEVDLLSEVLTEVIRHHDALRMVYTREEGKWTQYNEGLNDRAERSWFDLFVTTVPDGDEGRIEISRDIDRLHGSIDLAQGPLVKLGLFKNSAGDHLAIIIHHLVMDGISWRILFEDLTMAYNQAANGELVRLPAKTDSFQTWAKGLREYANSKVMRKEIEYWNKVECLEVKALPKSSSPSDSIKVVDNLIYSFQLSKIETENLLGKVHGAYSTEINDILLTALGRAVRQWTGEEKVLVCLEGHGREEIIKNINISRTVGWFTSVYPVVLDMLNSQDVSYHIKSVKENIRRIPNKGIGYGLLRYLTTEENREDIKFNLEPEIKFNYLGQFDTDVNTDVFSISDVPYGQTVSPDADREIALNIGGLVEEGGLMMFIEYSLQEYTEVEITKFGDYFKKQLTEVIKHCIEKDVKEVTPSDVGADVSIEELEAIMSFYNH
ncbi:non-ribosomal peptide synthetase [Paenibacillus sp. IHBB 10380]|uniref:non-ribosomal peptide synthetase n=1 Tax=Paenibacillus sp. IHBB 10380 TaxID=1566358 RepID=UPI0005CFE4FF|nr:non-ribosomal peptide synthetase [Paenibacillus sp. IHBB 10380]AJS57348.1 hypothetical protein UB51_01245 [Paenibacillus sp. IHBB 10380]